MQKASVKIAIVGAGVTGAYVYRLLASRGKSAHLFDRPWSTTCRTKPCAWGTSRGFADLLKAVGLEASRYTLARSDHIIMDGLAIKADLMTFDKQRLMRDLLRGAEVRHGEPDLSRYERIIDATGVARRYLPPVEDDIILPCVQYRLRSATPLENEIRLSGIGYAWRFPLSGTEYHVGCGTLMSDPRGIIEATGWIAGAGVKFRCACTGAIRLTAPHFSQPFICTDGGPQIWGVGEAIGCVAPLAGDGVVPGMRSAQLLVEHWDNPKRYTRAVLREFRWMKDERRVIDKLRSHEGLALKDAWVLKKNSRRMGMEVRVKQAITLMKHLGAP